MGRRGWSYFFDRRLKLRRLIIIWETLAKVVKAVYTYSAQIFTALGSLTKASIQYTYSILIKPTAGSQYVAKVQTAYVGTSATLKGRAFGLTARAAYSVMAATLRGSPYGLIARVSYTTQARTGTTTGINAQAVYRGAAVAMKGQPTGFRAQAQYTASTRQSAVSGTKFGTTASYSASVWAEVNPSWLPRFDLSVDKTTVNAFPGATYSITFTVTNVGGLSAQAEVSVWDVDGTLKDQFTVELSPGTSYSKSISFKAPQDPGTYYVTAQAENLFASRVDDAVSVQVNVAQAQ